MCNLHTETFWRIDPGKCIVFAGTGASGPMGRTEEYKEVIPMITHENENGKVSVSSNVYTDIAGTAASNCFGVKGMAARSVKDGVYHLLRKESASKGVRIEFHEDDSISIDLHIMVDHGVNLTAVGSSIISEVRYVVTNTTGTQVRDVNVYIDSVVIG